MSRTAFRIWMVVLPVMLLAVVTLYCKPATAVRMGPGDFDKKMIVEYPQDYKRVFPAVSEKPAIDFDGWRITPVVEPYMIGPPRMRRGGWYRRVNLFFG